MSVAVTAVVLSAQAATALVQWTPAPTARLARPAAGRTAVRMTAHDAPADDAPADVMQTALSRDGFVSAKAIVNTKMVADAVEMQQALPLAGAALGRALTCTLLLAEGLKDEETFQVQFKGDGPLKGVLAISNGRLEAKGYVGNPEVQLAPNAKGKLDVSGAMGKGSLMVTRCKELPGDPVPKPYQSITDIRSGEVAEDINYYLYQSEQREGALAAGVHFTPDSKVDAAGGWTVQLLPGTPDEVAAKLGENLQAMNNSPTEMVLSGMTAKDVCGLILKDMEPTYFEPHTPTYTCTCSRERLDRTMALLPIRDVVNILESDEELSARCHFCGKLYIMDRAEVQAKLDERIKMGNQMDSQSTED